MTLMRPGLEMQELHGKLRSVCKLYPNVILKTV